jgi:hypothetical protein
MSDDTAPVESLPARVRNWTIEPEASRPWTVKAVPDWVRDQAHKAARKDGITLGRWLTRVIPVAAQTSSGDTDPSPPEADQVSPELSPDPELFGALVSHGLPELDAALKAAEVLKLMGQTPGLPRSVTRVAHRMLRARLEAAGGLRLAQRAIGSDD